MMQDPDKRPVTIEDLLKVKRSERPQADFWKDWQASTRARLSVASRQPRPWWKDALPQLGIFIVRHQYTMGAACVAALALTVFQSETGAVAPLPGSVPSSVLEAGPAHPAPALSAPPAPVSSHKLAPVASLRHVRQASAAITRLEDSERFSPVDLVIAANLAEYEAGTAEIGYLGEPFAVPGAGISGDVLETRHPLRLDYAPLLSEESPVDMSRHERLLSRMREDSTPVGRDSRGDRLSLRF